MNSATREGSGSSSEQLPPKVITERNWQEFRAQGWAFYCNYIQDNSSAPEDVAYEEEYFGRDNVHLGDAYDLDEKRPLANKPGFGAYIGPDAFEYAKTHHPDEDWPQPSSGTGPASS